MHLPFTSSVRTRESLRSSSPPLVVPRGMVSGWTVSSTGGHRTGRRAGRHAAPPLRQPRCSPPREAASMLFTARRRSAPASPSGAGRGRHPAHQRGGHHPAENLLAAISLAEPFAPGDRRRPRRRAGSSPAPAAAAMRQPPRGPARRRLPPGRAAPPRRRPRTRPRPGPAARRTSRSPPARSSCARRRTCRCAPSATPSVAADRAAQADPVLGHPGRAGRPAGRLAGAEPARPAPGARTTGAGLPAPGRRAPAGPRARRRAGTTPSLAPVFMLAGLLVAGCLASRRTSGTRAASGCSLGLLGRRRRRGAAAACSGSPTTPRSATDLRPAAGPGEGRPDRLPAPSSAWPSSRRPTRRRRPSARAWTGWRAAYRQFNLAAGNGLVPRRLRLAARDLRALRPLRSRPRSTPVLNTRELAGLWHLPQARADVPLLERTGRPASACPCRSRSRAAAAIGVSAHQGRAVPVALPDELLAPPPAAGRQDPARASRRSCCAWRSYLMEPAPSDGGPPALVLVDPHRDLAQAVLGLVPPGAARRRRLPRRGRATDRPFGLNLLDAGLGWDRDKAVVERPDDLPARVRPASGARAWRTPSASRC